MRKNQLVAAGPKESMNQVSFRMQVLEIKGRVVSLKIQVNRTVNKVCLPCYTLYFMRSSHPTYTNVEFDIKLQ